MFWIESCAKQQVYIDNLLDLSKERGVWSDLNWTAHWAQGLQMAARNGLETMSGVILTR